MRNEKVVSVEYRLVLVKTNEYIQETYDENIYIKTTDKDEAFWTTNLSMAIDVGVKICREKHLEWNKDIKVETTMYVEESWLI